MWQKKTDDSTLMKTMWLNACVKCHDTFSCLSIYESLYHSGLLLIPLKSNYDLQLILGTFQPMYYLKAGAQSLEKLPLKESGKSIGQRECNNEECRIFQESKTQ